MIAVLFRLTEPERSVLINKINTESIGLRDLRSNVCHSVGSRLIICNLEEDFGSIHQVFIRNALDWIVLEAFFFPYSFLSCMTFCKS